MTCVVGLVENGVVYIGADSLGSNYMTKKIRSDKKVFRSNDVAKGVFGFAGSYRMGQILMYANSLIDSRDEPNINHKYMVTNFIPRLRSLFTQEGFEYTNSGQASASGGVFLFGYDDKLYAMYDDYQIAEPTHSYLAIGSGELHATGSLYSTEGLEMTPQERIIKALKSAQEFAVGVEGPFYIINTQDDKVQKYDRNGLVAYNGEEQ